MSPSRRSSSPSFSLVAAAVAVRNSLKMNRVTYVPTGGWSRRGRDHPRKHHVRSQGLEQARTGPGHAVEPRQTAKQTVLLTPSDDALRERRSDPRQPRDLRHVGAVEVDPLTGEERARQPGSGAGGGAQRGVAMRGCVDGDEPHVARRGGGGRRQRIADPGTRQGQQRKQESGTAVVHVRTLTAPPLARGTRCMHAAPQECGAREHGTRESKRGTEGPPP